MPATIIADHSRQLGFLVSAELLLEVPQNVLEHIHVLAHRRLHSQRFHKQLPIPGCEFLGAVEMSLTDQPPEHLALLRAVGHQQILMDRVKLHQGLFRGSASKEILPTAVTEDPFDKILSERRITEPSLFLNWNQRKLFHKGPRKQSDALPVWCPMRSIETNSLDPAAR